MTGSQVLIGNTLIDVQVTGAVGVEVATVPALRVGELLLFPRPVVQHDTSGLPTELVLDLRRWLLSLPDGLYVPVECDSSAAAVDAARAFREDAETGAISSYSPAQLGKWAAWWCEHRPDAAELDLAPGGTR